MNSIPLELLAPARNADTALAAIACGADAVYMGAPAFGARAAAGNSIEDIRRVVNAAHPFGVKVYIALNTILFDSELEEARQLICELYDAGVDALIIQDPAILSLDIPPIDLHASTQWNTNDPARLRLVARAGFSQLVVPREYSLAQIADIHRELGDDVSLEVFVHGALCVSHSGGCHAGQVLAGRSANRGACPQVCRLSFTLTDADGRSVAPPDGGAAERHWLSLADMNRLDSLAALADAGARSFKIEGRLKSESYVKNVTAAYSKALDGVVARSGGRYVRSSHGRTELAFNPDVSKSFNRGFSRYFLSGSDRRGISSWNTPKWTGLPVGKVKAVNGRGALVVDASVALSNGDGLGWFDADRRFHGFRINRVEGSTIHVAAGADIPRSAGVELYRNNDVTHEAAMARSDTSRRAIDVAMTLTVDEHNRPCIAISDTRGCRAEVTSSAECHDRAQTDQSAARRNTAARLGDTVYTLAEFDDQAGDTFIPASVLTALRREAVAALDSQWLAQRPQRRRRRKPAFNGDELKGRKIGFQANVSNVLARKFYTDLGAELVDDAVEVKAPNGEVEVMTTDYCLRRELGACLRSHSASRLPRELWLKAPMGRLRLHFDCDNCRMKIYTKANK